MKATLERSPLNIYTHIHLYQIIRNPLLLNYIYILHNNNKIQNIFVFIQYTQTNKIRNIYQSTKIYKQPNLNDTRKSKKIKIKKIKKSLVSSLPCHGAKTGGAGHAVVLLAYALYVQYPFLPIVCAHKTSFLHWAVYLYVTNKIRS